VYVDGISFDIKCIIKNVQNWQKNIKKQHFQALLDEYDTVKLPSEEENSHYNDRNQEHDDHHNDCSNNSHLHVVIITHNCCNEYTQKLKRMQNIINK